MNTHSMSTYHCISCGRIEHAVLETEPPQCCGQTMVKACEESIFEGEVAGEKLTGQSESALPKAQGCE